MLAKLSIFAVLFYTNFSAVVWEKTPKRTHTPESRKITVGEKEQTFFRNPILLNGIALDHAFFSINSRGKLAVVKGDPSSPRAVKIPFQVYLKRSGSVIRPSKEHCDWQGVTVDLGPVMALAAVGDELVIEPLRSEDALARRVIRLKLFWFLSLTSGKDEGC